jgi:putative spermidine/putrescine transport system substrate-binding protein
MSRFSFFSTGITFGLLATLLLSACQSPGSGPQGASSGAPADSLSWAQIQQAARGATVEMMMWQGDPQINRFMKRYVKPALQERYGLELKLLPGQGSQITTLLLNEKQAGRRESEIDMMWINGETFYQLQRMDALYGPFLGRLPHARYLDLENPYIGQDFQRPIEGMEAPWGNVQLTVIYDSLRTPQPPKDLAALSTYLKKHPGRFTIPNEFTGMTLLKSWMIGMAPDSALYGAFDKKLYRRYRDSLFTWIQAHRRYFWQKGATFPQRLAELHRLFAQGEVDFTFSNNDAEVENKIYQNTFPASARAYVYRSGTIKNSHYLGIVRWAQDPLASMVVINFLLSPEAQIEKRKPRVWGDGSVLSSRKLPDSARRAMQKAAQRRYAPARDSLTPYARQELAPAYMTRLYEDFQKMIVEGDA